MNSGFRTQELLTLKAEAIDFELKTVTVEAAYAKNSEQRSVPLGERLAPVLTEALATNGGAETVFVDRSGAAWGEASLRAAIRRARDQATLHDVSLHVLRHTYASRLVMAGVDLRTVQELLGHKDIKTTLIYAHLSPDHKQAAIQALETHFPAPSPANFTNSTPKLTVVC